MRTFLRIVSASSFAIFYSLHVTGKYAAASSALAVAVISAMHWMEEVGK